MEHIDPAIEDPRVLAAYDAFPKPGRDALLQIRAEIYDTAGNRPDIGRLQETLKWGQPSYLTPDTKSGSTLRLGLSKAGQPALFTHCQTTLMSNFQHMFQSDFTFDGNRAVYLDVTAPLPLDKLRLLISGALTYHLNK